MGEERESTIRQRLSKRHEDTEQGGTFYNDNLPYKVYSIQMHSHILHERH